MRLTKNKKMEMLKQLSELIEIRKHFRNLAQKEREKLIDLLRSLAPDCFHILFSPKNTTIIADLVDHGWSDEIITAFDFPFVKIANSMTQCRSLTVKEIRKRFSLLSKAWNELVKIKVSYNKREDDFTINLKFA